MRRETFLQARFHRCRKGPLANNPIGFLAEPLSRPLRLTFANIMVMAGHRTQKRVQHSCTAAALSGSASAMISARALIESPAR
jgi:hypothetical protein